MTWDGRKWCQRSDESVTEDLRQYCIDQLTQAVEALKSDNSLHPVVDGWRSMLKRHRLTAVIGLAKGIVERQVSEMDADPDVLNTPSGVVDLDTGELHPHDPTLLMTKITSGCYRPGYTHPDWEKALEALPTVEQEWFQVRVGQGITGHTTPDGVMPVMQGTGENGKSVLTTDGLVPALGDYTSMASPKLFQFSKGSEHSEERATLQGIRVLIAEELTEGRSIDITALKQIQDVGMITARHVFQKNMTFQASHSLFTTTNYVPVVNETDHGTWRRLALLRFPYTFRKPGEALQSDNDRVGDPTLKARIKKGAGGQHDAIVTWGCEADRIMGFWAERLIADLYACILTTEMLEAFNHWLLINNHNPWPKETFGPRFEQHAETIRHGVTVARTPQPKWLSRYALLASAGSPVPARPRVYQGVRFRNVSDFTTLTWDDPERCHS
jgi:putative DNA primase/helicase